MKLPIARIEDMTEPDHDILSNAYFDKEHGELVATDGSGMVVIPVESRDDDVSGCVPMEVMGYARKHKVYIELHDPVRAEARTSDGYLWQKRREGYPESVRRIISDVLADESDCTVISLDAKRLIQLAKALLDGAHHGDYKVTLRIRGGEEPILIKPYYDCWDSRFGIIMPLARRERK